MNDHTVAGELRATSDAFVAGLAEVTDMEQRKRSLQPTDPAFVQLADDVERSVRLLLTQSSRQRNLSYQARRAQLPTPIAAIPPDVSAAELLLKWRGHEDELAALDPDSPEARDARLNVETYRRAYHAVFESGEQQLEG
jgi:hypothetical protein